MKRILFGFEAIRGMVDAADKMIYDEENVPFEHAMEVQKVLCKSLIRACNAILMEDK